MSNKNVITGDSYRGIGPVDSSNGLLIHSYKLTYKFSGIFFNLLINRGTNSAGDTSILRV